MSNTTLKIGDRVQFFTYSGKPETCAKCGVSRLGVVARVNRNGYPVIELISHPCHRS